MSNEEERFRVIYKTYMPLVRIIARDKAIPIDEIDDFVQDTFAAYYSHYPLDWPERQMKAALITIVKHLCVDYYRKQETHLVTYCDPVTIQEAFSIYDQKFVRDNLSVYLEHQEYEEVLKAMKSMRPDWLEVFLLYIMEGRTMAEVSAILGISIDACRARLSRGRKYLRKNLCPEDPEKYRPTGRSKTSPLDDVPESEETSEIPEGT